MRLFLKSSDVHNFTFGFCTIWYWKWNMKLVISQQAGMLFIFLWGITLLLYIFSPLVAPAMKPETWPLIFFIIVFGLFLLPAPIFYHRTRFWLLRRIVSSKCVSIRIAVYVIYDNDILWYNYIARRKGWIQSYRSVRIIFLNCKFVKLK